MVDLCVQTFGRTCCGVLRVVNPFGPWLIKSKLRLECPLFWSELNDGEFCSPGTSLLGCGFLLFLLWPAVFVRHRFSLTEAPSSEIWTLLSSKCLYWTDRDSGQSQRGGPAEWCWGKRFVEIVLLCSRLIDYYSSMKCFFLKCLCAKAVWFSSLFKPQVWLLLRFIWWPC